MKALVLSLRGVLRSWGATSLGDDRWTEMRPTASAVIGMVGACAGIDRKDRDLCEAWYSSWDVVSASATDWWSEGGGRMLPGIRQDYQTAKNSMDMSGGLNDDAVVSRRGYLEESREAAAIVLRPDADEAFFDLAAAGLRQPVYTPYLGRRSNPLSEPMLARDGVILDGDRDLIVDRVIDRLMAPGLMEGKITVDGLELQANAGWLSQWTSIAEKKGLCSISLMSHRIADVKSGPMGAHSQRLTDVAHVQYHPSAPSASLASTCSPPSAAVQVHIGSRT